MRVERLFFFILFVLAGCGAKSEMGPERPLELDDVPPMDQKSRETYLRSFPLLNEEFRPGPPRDPSTGRAPFGVLLKLPSVGKVGACSAAHVSRGVLVTNSHCVGGAVRSGVGSFHFVYYGKENTKRYGSVEEFLYLGNGRRDDVALMKIDARSADDWDTIDSAVAKKSELAGQRPAPSENVIVWGFDPVDSRVNLPSAESRKGGMRFSPRVCLASRTQPTLVGLAGSDRTPIQISLTDEKVHFFLDECDRPLMQGNSGSLITSGDVFRRMWGVYHWAVTPTEAALKRFGAFEYTGNNNRPLRVERIGLTAEFFGVGSAFEHLSELVKILP